VSVCAAVRPEADGERQHIASRVAVHGRRAVPHIDPVER
jgi:hypothetical protein